MAEGDRPRSRQCRPVAVPGLAFGQGKVEALRIGRLLAFLVRLIEPRVLLTGFADGERSPGRQPAAGDGARQERQERQPAA